jgi:hypothetical protein
MHWPMNLRPIENDLPDAPTAHISEDARDHE